MDRLHVLRDLSTAIGLAAVLTALVVFGAIAISARMEARAAARRQRRGGRAS